MAASSCKPAAKPMKSAPFFRPFATANSARSSTPRMSTKSRRSRTRAVLTLRSEKLSVHTGCSNLSGMSTITEIREAIQKLSLEERAELLADLQNWEDDNWDRQMKADAAAGKFDEMNRRAEKAFRVGQ